MPPPVWGRFFQLGKFTASPLSKQGGEVFLFHHHRNQNENQNTNLLDWPWLLLQSTHRRRDPNKKRRWTLDTQRRYRNATNPRSQRNQGKEIQICPRLIHATISPQVHHTVASTAIVQNKNIIQTLHLETAQCADQASH